ncbi:MAG: tRNA pseudouridine(38-40) synthase TruA [Candidatus Latescibacterota bacterium]|nr:tRNA pseudouridine(38-40) synthase TruA [Candidatus Latescibacterota bacterium]
MTSLGSQARRIRLDMEYDGTDFVGWQTQAQGRTVQGELRRALGIFLQEEAEPVGSGRTDAGTHARAQVVHFETRSQHLVERMVPALNSLLPPDLAVLRALEVAETFHARYSAIGKHYRYRIQLRRHPLQRCQVWNLKRPALDEAAIRKAVVFLKGRHSFQAFCNADPPPEHFECMVREARWVSSEEEYRLDIEANRFLRHMVRIVVGTLVEVGTGRFTPDQFRRLVELPGRRGGAGVTAPACGLTLWQIHYPPAFGGASGAL